MQFTEQEIKDQQKYLTLLSKEYPTIQAVSTEIINLKAILDLPKGTEHFLSDLHGEDKAFIHILNNASGVIREKIDLLFENSIPAAERSELAALIYYPEDKLAMIKKQDRDMGEWYRITLHRLIDVCRLVASKYTRSKVRKALPKYFEYIIDELLHTNYDLQNKEQYYGRIISTIIDLDRADAFIVAMASLIKRLAVDCLHIIGDIFDRGPRADYIMDSLMRHHCVDIQWGNHDILWMGAAAGSLACIANVLHVSLQYNNLDIIEDGYGISLRELIVFAQSTYNDCSLFAPRLLDEDVTYNPNDIRMVSKLHKAIMVMLFKLEGQVILRHPEYQMQDRLLLNHIDYQRHTVEIDGVQYPLRDCDFPTIDPNNPYHLTAEEEDVMQRLKDSFVRSARLQEHVRFLFSQGSIYKCFNSNLLYHGCVPLNDDGSLKEVLIDGRMLSGKAMLDAADALVRQGYFASENTEKRRGGMDFMWYLWCGKDSPLFGRNKMTTFERCLIEDKSTWVEGKNAYYHYTDSEEACNRILEEFGLDPKRSHIINGHVPVKTKDGESPIKAGGRLIVIDGGFCKAYQKTTGIAGYTLIYNSQGMRLVSHEPLATAAQEAIEHNKDILSTSIVFETVKVRQKVLNTDAGKTIQERCRDLQMLLWAYRLGIIKEHRI